MKTKTQTLDPSKKLDDFFPARFLKVEHFAQWGVTEAQVEIAKVQSEEVQLFPQPKEMKLVFYFKTKAGGIHPQGYLVSSKADKDALKTACHAETVGELIGKKITIQISEWKSKPVLRISPEPVKDETK